ncbi:MAG TPA: 50S ribosomal protein L21 [bacterium]|nr:50S ribosomal protein L21 [Dictyoglomota bacterium]HHV81033.1 50S ribosomal protein L21 [bacterium]HOK29498.1 50S ribosomal protein L21 [bacterium]HON72534.1 50S ribosomal protein L21 [bacterium]HPC78269.1 50S ribosomal protein L21 [bacterium]
MYAIIETGGKQYKVSPGDILTVEKLDIEEGEEVVFDKVLMLKAQEGESVIGTPYIENIKVRGIVIEQFRGKKIIVFKYRPKKHYRRKRGHRQYLSRVKIEEVLYGS